MVHLSVNRLLKRYAETGLNDMIYRFNGITLDTTAFRLFGPGGPIAIEPKVFDLLVYLVEHRERVVPRDELLASIWPERVVSDSALSACLKAARKSIADNGIEQKLIKTVHGRGYQFVADLTDNSESRIDDSKYGETRSGIPAICIEQFSCLPENSELLALTEELQDQITVRLARRTGIHVVSGSPHAGGPVNSDYVLHGRVRFLASKCSVSIKMIWCKKTDLLER